jgi:hypothetical protein
MKYFIYTLADPISNEVKYIGKTKNLKDRFQRHMNPSMELLDEGDENDIDSLEVYWISQFKAWGFKLKNLTEGGQNPTPKGSRLKERHINNMKKSSPTKKIVTQYTIGNIFVAEYESISEAERQTKFRHISDCCNGKRKKCGEYYFRFKDNYYPYVERTDYWTGAHHSEESVEKMKMNHPFRKVICQYNIEDDKLIGEYESSHDVERITGLSRSHVIKCCKGIQNYNSVGGYYFRFKENYFPFIKQYASMGVLRKKYKLNIQ